LLHLIPTRTIKDKRVSAAHRGQRLYQARSVPVAGSFSRHDEDSFPGGLHIYALRIKTNIRISNKVMLNVEGTQKLKGPRDFIIRDSLFDI
jgi:hypothetical protein